MNKEIKGSNVQQEFARLVVFPSQGIIVHDCLFSEIHHLKNTVKPCKIIHVCF